MPGCVVQPAPDLLQRLPQAAEFLAAFAQGRLRSAVSTAPLVTAGQRMAQILGDFLGLPGDIRKFSGVEVCDGAFQVPKAHFRPCRLAAITGAPPTGVPVRSGHRASKAASGRRSEMVASGIRFRTGDTTFLVEARRALALVHAAAPPLFGFPRGRDGGVFASGAGDCGWGWWCTDAFLGWRRCRGHGRPNGIVLGAGGGRQD